MPIAVPVAPVARAIATTSTQAKAITSHPCQPGVRPCVSAWSLAAARRGRFQNATPSAPAS